MHYTMHRNQTMEIIASSELYLRMTSTCTFIYYFQIKLGAFPSKPLSTNLIEKHSPSVTRAATVRLSQVIDTSGFKCNHHRQLLLRLILLSSR